MFKHIPMSQILKEAESRIGKMHNTGSTMQSPQGEPGFVTRQHSDTPTQ